MSAVPAGRGISGRAAVAASAMLLAVLFGHRATARTRVNLGHEAGRL